ncbi:hypothetical protein Tco_0683202 [Tanacetum coccineum]|uniref:Transposase (Putative), gypsy type n=1 Tax=Tanacetum coccineum TaxID=301880 RepID=A0ABQ4XV18_9ASTR
MSFSKCFDNTPVCYTKPIDSLKNWNDHFFWVDSFVWPAIYPWHIAKTIFRDPPPQPTDFNANHYATLVAHPASFWKFPEPFLCLIKTSYYYTFDQDTYPSFGDNHDEEMNLTAFIHVLDPTKVKVVEKNRAKDEPKLLDTTLRRVVLLLPVALARSEAALKASVDKLFDEGGSRNQEDSATGDEGNNIVFGADLENVAAETVVAKKPTRYRKKRQAATDASGSTHPAKKLREDYGTSGGIATSGKSPSIIKELFERSVLNAEIGVVAITTLPFVTSSIFATPEHSSHHSSNNASEVEADSIIRSVDPPVMTEAVTTTDTAVVSSHLFLSVTADITSKIRPNTFLDSSSTDTLKPDVASASQRPSKELSLGSRKMIKILLGNSLTTWLLRRRTEYSHSERKRLEDECGKQAGLLKSKDDEIKILKAKLLRKETEATEAVRLHAQVTTTETAEKVHAEELDSLKQKNADLRAEKDSLTARVMDLRSFVSAKNLKLKDANAVVTSLKSQNDSLVAQVHALEVTCSGLRDQIPTYERLKEQFEEFQDVQMRMVGDKLAKLEVDLSEMALHLEEKFYPHLLTTIAGRRWLLTHGLQLFLTKCLNSSEYLSALGAAISRAIEKGMQDGLAAGIEHGAYGRRLEDLVAYNPSAEEDYNAVLQELRSVDFALLAELKSHKDASVETIMNLLRLESPLVDAPRMSDLQPDEDQLMVPIHRSEDQAVLGSTSLSFALSVSHDRVERIRKNIAEHWSVLAGVYVPLVEPLFVQNLTGATGTSDVLPTVVATTTALSTMFASTSTAPSVSVDDYIITNADNEENVQLNVKEENQGKGGGSAADMVEVEFEKEELGTTP